MGMYLSGSLYMHLNFRSWLGTSHHANDVFYLTTHLYAMVCSSYICFILRTERLSNKLLGHRYNVYQRTVEFLSKGVLWWYGDLIKQ